MLPSAGPYHYTVPLGPNGLPLYPVDEESVLGPEQVPMSSLHRRIKEPVWGMQTQKEQTTNTQERQNAYLRKIDDIKCILTRYFKDCNDTRLPKYETLFSNLWTLFLQLQKNKKDYARARRADMRESDEIYDIIHTVLIHMQDDQFDEYTIIFVAAYYAFILQDDPQSDGTIPFRFLSCLLQQRDRTDTYVDDVVHCISQYYMTNDLSYNHDTTAIQQNEPTLDHILRSVRMLSVFESLLKFCTLKYTSVKEMERIWDNTISAYGEYMEDPLDMNFYAFFSEGSGNDMFDAVGITVDAQSVQALLESDTFLQAVQRIDLPLVSARKSQLTRKEVHDVLHEAYEMQKKWEALNRVLTELKTADAHAQDEGRSIIEQRVKNRESKLHSLVEKLCEEYVQLQNLQVLSEQLQRLLESNAHAASTEAMPKDVFTSIKRGISRMLPQRKKQSNKKTTDKTSEKVPETMRQEAENDLEEQNTPKRLIALIRKFCTVTLDEKSIGALETLWVEIRQEFDKLTVLQGLVGMYFRKENADIPVSADQVIRFVTSETFADAVEHIGLAGLVTARIMQPTRRQSTQLAQAFRCTERLDEQHWFENVLITKDVATESASYSAIQNAVTKEEYTRDKALGQLYADRQVLPGLLEELKSFKA